MNNILANASEAQKQKYLPGLNSGKLIGAPGLTEPGAGSDAIGSMRTTARREGDLYYLNGRKVFITNGPVADVLLRPEAHTSALPSIKRRSFAVCCLKKPQGTQR